MLVFAEIPSEKLPELLAIETRSNAYAWSVDNLIDSHKHYAHLGAFLDGHLIAFIIYRLVADEGEIIHLICDQKLQGRGYAYQLFSQLIKQNQQHIKRWHLEVRANNAKAIQLYQRLGFVEVGRRKAYYQQKEDAILMRLQANTTLNYSDVN